MTQQYSNENSGVLFKNKDKTDAHPTWADYEGSINVNGKDYYLSAWLKEAKSGVKYMSLSVKEKVSRQQAAEQTVPTYHPAQTGGDGGSAPPSFDNFDDDIPF